MRAEKPSLAPSPPQPITGLMRLFGEAGWLALAKIVQGAAALTASTLIARHLGPSTFGQLSLAIATATFVGAAATLGLEHIATREFSTRNDHALISLRRLRWSGALLGSLVLFACGFIPALKDYGIATLLLVMCLLPIAQVGDISEWNLIATGRSRSVTIVTLIVAPIMAGLRVLLVIRGATVSVFAATVVVEWMFRSLALGAISHRMPSSDGSNSSTHWINQAARLLRECMPLLAAGIAIFVYMRIDQYMIAAMLGSREVGYYAAIVTLAEIPLVVPALLLRAALPVLSRQSHDNPNRRDQLLVLLVRWAFYVHLTGALALVILAPQIVQWTYGDAFSGAVTAFRIQVLAAPFVAIGVLSSAWLVLEHRTQHALWRSVTGAIINIILNLGLIPAFGIAGAAFATVVAQIFSSYLSDGMHAKTRSLFRLKTYAIFPLSRNLPSEA